jgi:hypothetical protein
MNEKHVAKAIIVVGLAFVSCWAWIYSSHAIGAGWAIIAIIAWL